MRILNAGAARLATLVLWAALVLPHVANAQTTLKVLDWNTHHGVGTDGDYDLQRFVTWIARSGAHVVSLNEVEKNDSWGNEDQPARYAALLKAATGKTWYHTFAQRDGGTNGQGNLILSSIPFEATGAKTLSYSRSVARAQIVVNGVRVNIFSTHLDADSSSRRATQMDELERWASGFSQQHILAGDFNAWPGATEISNMTAFAYDAWDVAKTKGTAVAYDGNSAGNTRNSRIDYVWYAKKATQLVLKGAQVFDTRDSSGVMPSDHRPVMATFQVGSGTTSSGTTSGGTTSGGTTSGGTTSGGGGSASLMGDFDGDSKSDVSVFRPATGQWFVARSSAPVSAVGFQWGLLSDVPAPADYDGDGKLDVAVYRPFDPGGWYVWYSRSNSAGGAHWGLPGDKPVPADYDGDGKADFAVFRPLTAEWWVLSSGSSTSTRVQWGLLQDIPVPADYDGDGRADIAVFRPANGTWYIRYARGGQGQFQWGLNGDIPVPGDYDGDGRMDCAVFRPSNAMWYVRYSANGSGFTRQWGLLNDIPVAADYDGDGRTDVAVFRPSNAIWYLRYSSNGSSGSVQWGLMGDTPVTTRR